MTTVSDVGIADRARFAAAPPVSAEFCRQAIQQALKKIDANLIPFRDKFPAPASQRLVYPAIDNVEWTSSFWTGMLWLAFEVTGESRYREAAEHQLASYRKRVDERIMTDTHDLGFLYSLSCVSAHQLTGNQEAAKTALKAADLLMERYFAAAGIIQAWGDLKDAENRGRMIIDCAMNLPLLYWASRMTGDPRYRQAACRHASQSARYIIRPDASSYHTFYMDVETGAPRFGRTNQGYADDSCWARGQAWGIYGFALSYRHNGDAGLLELDQKITNYFLNRLPADYVCYWDLVFTSGPEERDSSAAAIAACGLLELAAHLPLTNPNRRLYENAALHIVKSLAEHYTTANCPTSNGLLQHAVYSKPGRAGVDECNIWGDYFYLEALVRLVKDWKPYW